MQCEFSGIANREGNFFYLCFCRAMGYTGCRVSPMVTCDVSTSPTSDHISSWNLSHCATPFLQPTYSRLNLAMNLQISGFLSLSEEFVIRKYEIL